MKPNQMPPMPQQNPMNGPGFDSGAAQADAMQGPGPMEQPSSGQDEAIDALVQMAISAGIDEDTAAAFIESPQFDEAMEYWDGGGDMGLEMMQYKFMEFVGADGTDLDSISGNAGMTPATPHKGNKGGYDMDGPGGGYSQAGDMMPVQNPGSQHMKGNAKQQPDVFEDGSSKAMKKNAQNKSQARLKK